MKRGEHPPGHPWRRMGSVKRKGSKPERSMSAARVARVVDHFDKKRPK